MVSYLLMAEGIDRPKSIEEKTTLCIWIPHHTEHISTTPKQHNIDFFFIYLQWCYNHLEL